MTVVLIGTLALAVFLAVAPKLPTQGNFMASVLIVIFGFFFVTVSSRIVGLIGNSSNPISGMTIATLILTCTIFVALGWTGDAYSPDRALRRRHRLHRGRERRCDVPGSEDRLHRRGDTPVSADRPHHRRAGVLAHHRPHDALPARQDGDWIERAAGPAGDADGHHHQGAAQPEPALGAGARRACSSPITLELCGIQALSFAVGSYLPIATTAPIFAGGLVRAWVERRTRSDAGVRGQLGHALQLGTDCRRIAGRHPLCAALRIRPHSRCRGRDRPASRSCTKGRRGLVAGALLFLALGPSSWRGSRSAGSSSLSGETLLTRCSPAVGIVALAAALAAARAVALGSAQAGRGGRRTDAPDDHDSRRSPRIRSSSTDSRCGCARRPARRTVSSVSRTATPASGCVAAPNGRLPDAKTTSDVVRRVPRRRPARPGDQRG